MIWIYEMVLQTVQVPYFVLKYLHPNDLLWKVLEKHQEMDSEMLGSKGAIIYGSLQFLLVQQLSIFAAENRLESSNQNKIPNRI